MTKADELLGLADRCEREEASWQLTCEIEAAITPDAYLIDCRPQGGALFLRIWGKREWKPAPYTTSLDAALTLLPEGWTWLRKSDEAMTCANIPCNDRDWGTHIDAGGKSPALALCAAALRARVALAVSHQNPGAMRAEGEPPPPPRTK